VNGDAPFFTAYHTARLAGDRHHPVFLAFHVRSDVARARVASLLPLIRSPLYEQHGQHRGPPRPLIAAIRRLSFMSLSCC
jgi:hypothetical protein